MKPGTRVLVRSGIGFQILGEGVYQGDVVVYAWFENGVLQSFRDAEEIPHPENVPPGVVVQCIAENPKILLDNGQIVYGCQVWWEPIVDP